MRKILIAEDDEGINRALCLYLSLTGYETVSFHDGAEVLEWLRGGDRADLAVLDIMMPKVDGFELLAPLQKAEIPVLFLTARGDIEAKYKGLTEGAEDYMVKPFEMLELLVRVEKILKRYHRTEETMVLGDVTINTAQRKVFRENEELTGLTPMEYDLLLMLARHRNVALSRDQLLDAVWGYDYPGTTRTVDVHIAQLRRKTGLNILSVPKVGYRLEVEP